MLALSMVAELPEGSTDISAMEGDMDGTADGTTDAMVTLSYVLRQLQAGSGATQCGHSAVPEVGTSKPPCPSPYQHLEDGDYIDSEDGECSDGGSVKEGKTWNDF